MTNTERDETDLLDAKRRIEELERVVKGLIANQHDVIDALEGNNMLGCYAFAYTDKIEGFEPG